MRSPHPSLVILFIFLLLIFNGICFAEEVVVKIKAQKVKYEDKKTRIIATGSVEAYFDDVIISSDRMVINTRDKITTAEGNILIIRDDQRARASTLVYNISAEVMDITGYESTFDPQRGGKGVFFTKAQTLRDSRELKLAKDTDTTSCDQSEPHYHMTAKEVEYYPDDRIVAKNITLFAGKAPVMWAPFFVYDLKGRRNSSLIPEFGENPVEGQFLKWDLDYYFNKNSSGLLYIDTMQIKGFGHGFSHDYNLNRLGEGNLYLYHVHEQDLDKDAWDLRLKHTFKPFKDTTFTISERTADIYLIPSGRLRQTENHWDYLYNANQVKTNLKFDNTVNFENNIINKKFQSIYTKPGFHVEYFFDQIQNNNYLKSEYSQNHFMTNFSLGPNFKSKLTANYFTNITAEGTPADERLEPQIDLNYTTGIGSFQLLNFWRIDTDADKYQGDNRDEFIERIPEIKFRSNNYSLADVNLTSYLSYARFRESKFLQPTQTRRDFTTDRYQLGTSAKRSFPLPLSSNALAGLNLEQFLYGPGDARYVFGESLAVNSAWFGFISNNILYRNNYGRGNSPFYFDLYGQDNEALTEKLSFYNGNIFNFSLASGYNYTAREYFDITSVLNYNPNQSYLFKAQSGYSIKNKRYLDLVIRNHYKPAEKTEFLVDCNYSLVLGQLQSAQSKIKFGIGNSWQSNWYFSFDHYYDILANSLKLRQYEIIKDLHCWEARLSFNDFQKEYLFTMSLKIFPGNPLTYSSAGRHALPFDEGQESKSTHF